MQEMGGRERLEQKRPYVDVPAMKIVLLQDDFFPEAKGGAAVVVLNLANEFSSRGHRVMVITSTQDKQKEGADSVLGTSVYRVYSNYHPRWRAYLSLYNPRAVRPAKIILDKMGPDVVHVHNVHQHLSYYMIK
ncbi:MAG: glycosyltransferase family 4 protein, partial [Candidatus Colwellbacteria bacterium]